jgi:alkanesulfonate monooxygenase SsuD/methylene tetrahydromethanopterin reductase-like flavin-dependent oxidoreductase (luciferase family)
LPGPLAVALAEVDAMSGGRIELGLGSGWFEAEHLQTLDMHELDHLELISSAVASQLR